MSSFTDAEVEDLSNGGNDVRWNIIVWNTLVMLHTPLAQKSCALLFYMYIAGFLH